MNILVALKFTDRYWYRRIIKKPLHGCDKVTIITFKRSTTNWWIRIQ